MINNKWSVNIFFYWTKSSYFEDIIRFWDRDFSDNLLDEKLCKEKKGKYLHLWHFIQVHNKIRYLVLFDSNYCDKIGDKIKYLISEKVVLQIVLRADTHDVHLRGRDVIECWEWVISECSGCQFVFY